MSTFLITSANLISPGHTLDGQKVDILIKDGVIADIASKITAEKNVQTIDVDGSTVSAGFFDLNVNIGEPGYETKEDVATGTAAAAEGGFTGIAVHPNTNPSIQSRAEVSLLVNAAKGNLVDVHPIGAISKKREGNELAELYDMKINGALAFCDGNRSVQQAGLMGRALLYSKGFEGLIISFAQDESIAGGNQMNEGIMSTYLGMKGIPNLAESLMVSRDLYLAEYNEAPIHFTTISTAESVELIKKAKAKGLKVTCDVAAHNLIFTDDYVEGFDSNYKVSPPLRTKKDVKALLKGLKEGVIDAVVSQHTPQEIEFKDVEFQIAKNGISGLQTVLPLLIKAGLSDEQIVDKLVIGSRKVVRLDIPILERGTKANLVVFNRNEKWTFDEKSNKSKGKNNPLFGSELVGKVKLVVNNNQLIINN
jgi:dihydroorotase